MEAPGHDIPARILQLAANELAPALQIIFQKSLETGKLSSAGLRTGQTGPAPPRRRANLD